MSDLKAVRRAIKKIVDGVNEKKNGPHIVVHHILLHCKKQCRIPTSMKELDSCVGESVMDIYYAGFYCPPPCFTVNSALLLEKGLLAKILFYISLNTFYVHFIHFLPSSSNYY